MINWDNPETWQVLLVDDQPDVLVLVGMILKRNGIKIRTALNGQEALKALDGFTPDLVITDLTMPVMDGWELRDYLKHTPKFQQIPVLALTALSTVNDKARALAAGFDGYLTKPVNVTTLVTDIRTTAREVSNCRGH